VTVPNNDALSPEEKAEILRKRARYRELILSGALRLPHGQAARLLGPDCLYHLYAVSPKTKPARKRRNSSKRR
jgi:hypothetical protein